ncbi:MAG TPA: hypothetical protein VNV60_02330 [Holophagaceae bacterium]|nr:hypothetical protein [Holophagaceae bacterium]
MPSFPDATPVWALLVCMSPVSAQAPTLPAPEIFAPGVISGPANDGAPAFTPDGNTAFFSRGGGSWSAILESHRVDGRWSEPVIAPFSGEWSDSQPAVSPDGSFLVFVSWRPVDGNPEARVANLWRVDRQGHSWSSARRLPATVNINTRIFKPSVAADGSVYFMSIQSNGKMRLFSSRCVGGVYQAAQPLPFSDDATADVDPEIAPDQSFLVFSSAGRHPGDTTHERLYITLHARDGWGPVAPIRYAGDENPGPSNDNEAHLSPDGRTLYFDSDRTLSVPHPRAREQTQEDLRRVQSWDNGNTNAWSIPFRVPSHT